ncbi:MAG: carboxypeptidase regulatory-like domain-containing protein [Bacteroidota bacterium]
MTATRLFHYVALAVLAALVVTVVSPLRGQQAYRERPVALDGTVKGTVKLRGPATGEQWELVTKDTDYCGKRKSSQRLLVGKGSGVENAVVYLEAIAGGKKFSPTARVTLRQRSCEYEPHILLLPPNAELEIVNDDPVLHNVHAYDVRPVRRSVFNIAQPLKGQRTRLGADQLRGEGEVVATCDAGHPWMSGYVFRMAHPYYAVTNRSGEYLLENVPPGRYTLKMWHEGVAVRSSRVGVGAPPTVEDPYELSQEISVAPRTTCTADFELVLRTPVSASE